MTEAKGDLRPDAPPVIGILAMDYATSLRKLWPDTDSYISASYVKFLETSGALVIPIRLNETLEYYEDILSRIDGLLWPGGAVDWTFKGLPNYYVENSRTIFHIASRKNREGKVLPLWSICLGFQFMLLHSMGELDHRIEVQPMRESLPLKWKSSAENANSTLLASIPRDVKDIMATEPVAFFLHRYALTEKILEDNHVRDQWHVLATYTNKDLKDQNIEVLALIEHVTLPFYGCQFHPEKTAHDNFRLKDPCNHDQKCVDAVHYFGKFFINKCRESTRQRWRKSAANISSFEFNMLNDHIAHIPLSVGAEDPEKKWWECYLFKDPRKGGEAQKPQQMSKLK